MASAEFLIFSAAIIGVFILGISFVTIIKFQHPDDKNQAFFPKLVVLLSFTLLFGSCLIMPFDVLNREGDLNFDVDILWLVCLISVGVFVLFLLPFSYFFYENDRDEIDSEGNSQSTCCTKQFWPAFWYSIVFCIIIALLALVLYATPANTAIIPVRRIVQGANQMVSICTGATVTPYVNANPTTACVPKIGNAVIEGGCAVNALRFNWEISVTYPVYFLALLSFIGWWFFFIFAGVGLVSLPMGLINDYRRRPKPMAKSAFLSECDTLGMRAENLVKQATELRDGARNQEEAQGFWERRKQRKSTRKITELENEFHMIRRDYDILKMSYEFSKSNPLWFFLKLFLGIIGIVISLLWIIHIAIFVLPGKNNRIHPFLNLWLEKLTLMADGDFPLFGVIFFAILCFWLQWCTIDGNQRFGLRFLLWRFYPLEVGNTLMNAFIANLWVLMLCIFPQIQFVSQALPIYARYTAIEALFGQQVRYLKGLKVFWEHSIFVIMLLAMSFLTLLVMYCCPGDRNKKLNKKIEERMTQRNGRIK